MSGIVHVRVRVVRGEIIILLRCYLVVCCTGSVFVILCGLHVVCITCVRHMHWFMCVYVVHAYDCVCVCVHK